MKLSRSVSRYILIAAFTGASSATFAQTQSAPPVGSDLQRDTTQQQRIEQGLKSGQLTPNEASQLERQESHVDSMEQRDLRNGSMSPQEQQRLNAAQGRVSQDIYSDKHNAVTGRPNSLSSQRMESDVNRDVVQQQRIEKGVQNGTLTNGEAGALEGGEKQTDRAQAGAAANGHIGANEQKQLNHDEQYQSNQIYNKRHNDRDRQPPQH